MSSMFLKVNPIVKNERFLHFPDERIAHIGRNIFHEIAENVRAIQPCSDAAEPALFHKGEGAHRLNSTARDANIVACSWPMGKKEAVSRWWRLRDEHQN